MHCNGFYIDAGIILGFARLFNHPACRATAFGSNVGFSRAYPALATISGIIFHDFFWEPAMPAAQFSISAPNTIALAARLFFIENSYRLKTER
jgi:hypothetical protein